MDKIHECVKKEPEIKQWFDTEKPSDEIIADLEKNGDKLCGIDEGMELARAYLAGHCDALEIDTCMNYLCLKNNASRIVGSKPNLIKRFFEGLKERKYRVLRKIFSYDYMIDDSILEGERMYYSKVLWFDTEQPSEDEVNRYRENGYEFHNLIRSVQMAKEYAEGRKELLDTINEINDFIDRKGVELVVGKEWLRHLLDEMADCKESLSRVEGLSVKIKQESPAP